MNWIDVENDRMPDHNGTVLCCNVNNEDAPICLGVQVADGESDFYLFELGEKSNRITHWMELPPKPSVG